MTIYHNKDVAYIDAADLHPSAQKKITDKALHPKDVKLEHVCQSAKNIIRNVEVAIFRGYCERVILKSRY